MIALAPSLLAVGGARTGIAPANLLEVLDVNGNTYFWGSRQLAVIAVMTGVQQTFLPWLLSVPSFTFHRSLVTDSGIFKVQNLSGNTLARDFETKIRASALEGAEFVYRCWQPDAEAAWIEVHGTLTIDDTSPDEADLKGMQMLQPAQDDTPVREFCETCQNDWATAQCGSTQPTECNYSFQSCQVVERIAVVLNDYEKNWGEATANTPIKVINRDRRY